MKRAQEMRIAEFSRNVLRESHANIQELTSQIQEVQERTTHMNDAGELQDVDSIRSEKLSHAPSQPAIVPSLCGMLSRDKSLRLDTWYLLGTSGNVFDSPRAVRNSSSSPSQGTLHFWNQSALKAKNEIERRFQRRDLQGNHQPRILTFQQKDHIHRITWVINQDCGSRSFNMINLPHLQRFNVGK